MEDILASIKKVIAEEKSLRASGVPAVPARTAKLGEEPPEEVLELDEPVIEHMNLPEPDLGPPLLSQDSAETSRQRLAALQQVAAAAPVPPQGNPLEAMIRDMLKPILKDWLDQHLPAIVDEHVRREISRITGQKL